MTPIRPKHHETIGLTVSSKPYVSFVAHSSVLFIILISIGANASFAATHSPQNQSVASVCFLSVRVLFYYFSTSRRRNHASLFDWVLIKLFRRPARTHNQSLSKFTWLFALWLIFRIEQRRKTTNGKQIKIGGKYERPYIRRQLFHIEHEIRLSVRFGRRRCRSTQRSTLNLQHGCYTFAVLFFTIFFLPFRRCLCVQLFHRLIGALATSNRTIGCRWILWVYGLNRERDVVTSRLKNDD